MRDPFRILLEKISMQATAQARGNTFGWTASCLDAAMRERSSDVATMSAVEYH